MKQWLLKLNYPGAASKIGPKSHGLFNSSERETKMKHLRRYLLLALLLSVPATDFPEAQAGGAKGKAESKAQPDQKPSKQVKDPVCGMEIDAKSAAGKANYKGKTYYFCSVSEKEQFEKEPAKYVK